MENERFEKVIKRILDGDKDALREIYDEYVTLVYSVVSDIVGNRQDAEDITTDFFVKLWKSASSYKFGGAHKKWMMTIARNMSIDFLRSKKQVYPMEEIETAADTQSPFEDMVENKSFAQRILESLKSDEREIVTLKIVGGFTFKEISEMVGKPQGTVIWKYNRILEKVRGQYSND